MEPSPKPFNMFALGQLGRPVQASDLHFGFHSFNMRREEVTRGTVAITKQTHLNLRNEIKSSTSQQK